MGTFGWVATITAILSLGALIWAALAWLYRKVLKPLSLLVEDWAGEEGRPGVPRRLGVMERLANIDIAQRDHATRIGVLEERMSAFESRIQP